MGFINNNKDAFLPNSHPWDDEAKTYSLPPQTVKRKLSEASYDDLRSMLEEMSFQYKQISEGNDKHSLKEKMMSVIQEIKQRDDLEESTSQERGDAFEQPLESPIINNESNDVPTPHFQPVSTEEPLFNDADNMDMGDDDLDMFEYGETIDEDLDDEDDDLYEDEVLENKNGDDTTNFLLGALIVIVLIAITKK